ncbi:type II CRISPR-associated endonuclease Cas1 [Weissella confusa]|uniref:type II CRISPR-associated endonuclease Cas1 n=1 Tax=Weissella confusa TaxID=1583 RepID=UPI0021AE8113|nr:type II CRISPR-associated endonuclease Cas1 [Weissella confusa]MCS9997248.1 type II CRISPR-associated endonuclease Cas1 [Weissella confusa]
MGFRTIVINAHSKLSYKNNHLVYKSIEDTQMIHVSEIDVMICETTDIVISTMLINKLIEAGVLLIMCDAKRLPNSMVMPYYGRHDTSLQIQKQVEWKLEDKEKIWTDIITQKISNQAALLRKVRFDDIATDILNAITQLELNDPANVEGHAARTSFNTLFGNDFVRDEVTEVNKGLDYGYTLILSLFAREIVKCGCLTQLGIKHTNQYNQFNLASDLMEPFRVLVDEIVYDNKSEAFPRIKRELFTLFSETYRYNGSDMYLTNIISDYVKKVLDCLHGEREEVPVFRVTE